MLPPPVEKQHEKQLAIQPIRIYLQAELPEHGKQQLCRRLVARHLRRVDSVRRHCELEMGLNEANTGWTACLLMLNSSELRELCRCRLNVI